MAFFAVIKLFVLDLQNLDTIWRIVSYFAAGIVLLAISFTYQWFNKRLEASIHLKAEPEDVATEPTEPDDTLIDAVDTDTADTDTADTDAADTDAADTDAVDADAADNDVADTDAAENASDDF